MKKWNTPKKPRIGIYTMGLKAYLNQFPGLRERLMHYGQFIAEKIAKMNAVVFFYGLADCEEAGISCGEFFNSKNVEPNVSANQALLLAGSPATQIFSKTFLDTFVFLGGCGCALSFVISLCLVSRKSHNRKIAYAALPSAAFNISEIAVFGFPIIFNFTMAAPFILTPVTERSPMGVKDPAAERNEPRFMGL